MRAKAQSSACEFLHKRVLRKILESKADLLRTNSLERCLNGRLTCFEQVSSWEKLLPALQKTSAINGELFVFSHDLQ